MHIQDMPLDAIRPYPNNPRKNDNAVAAVADSLQQFGFRQPIVVDSDHVIVIGHTRYKAAQQLQLATIPVHVADNLSAERIKALRIADNKSGELAEWDGELLPIELGQLQDTGYDIAHLGFDADDLAKLLDGAVHDGLTDADAVPEDAPTRCQPGDVWQLGGHRLVCGDATDHGTYAALLGDDQVQLLLTDPPYNVNYQGATTDKLTIANDHMDADTYLKFLTDTFQHCHAALAPGAAFYIWHADSWGHSVRNACTAIGMQIRQCLIWKKDSLVLGKQDYHWIHEPCLYGWKDGAAHTWMSDRSQTTVLEFARPKRSSEHPTMKPIDLISYQILNSSYPDSLVLDCFGGSGSTLIACEQTGRRARLLELDPHYADVIIKRYEDFSGNSAERVHSAMASACT